MSLGLQKYDFDASRQLLLMQSNHYLNGIAIKPNSCILIPFPLYPMIFRTTLRLPPSPHSLPTYPSVLLFIQTNFVSLPFRRAPRALAVLPKAPPTALFAGAALTKPRSGGSDSETPHGSLG